MSAVKIAVTIDQNLLTQLDELVQTKQFPSRSRAVQEAVRDKLSEFKRKRLARECAKLDPAEEQAMAEEGFAKDMEIWPEY